MINGRIRIQNGIRKSNGCKRQNRIIIPLMAVMEDKSMRQIIRINRLLSIFIFSRSWLIKRKLN